MVVFLIGSVNLVFALITFGLGIAGIVSLVRSLRLQLYGVHADGLVVGYEVEQDGCHYPNIEFVVAGASHRITGNKNVRAEGCPVGKPVRVLYMPRDPSRATIDTFLNNYSTALACGIALAVVSPFSIGLIYLQFFYNR